MEALVMIVIFMIISFGSVLGGLFFGKKYEKMLPLTHFAIIIIMFFAGITNSLYMGLYIICFVVIIGYILCIVYLIKNRCVGIEKIKKNILTRSFWIFLISYVLIWGCNIGKEIHHYDEFSCWGARVKDMCRLDMLYTSEFARSWAQSYPPATALLQYLYEKIQYVIVGENKFVAWYLFISYQIFMISFLISLLSQLKIKKYKWNFLGELFILTLPMIFYTYAYDTIMVDPLLGVMLGYCFVLLINKKGTFFEWVSFVMCQIVLCLTKDVVILLCFFMWIFWIVDDIVQNHYKVGKWVQKNIFLDLTGFLFFYFFRFIWNYHLIEKNLIVEGSSSLISANEALSLGVFFKIIVGRIRDYRQSTFLSYCRAFFSSGYLKIKSFNLGISYFSLLILFIVVSLYLNRLYKQHYEKKRQGYLTVGVYVMMASYLGVVMLTYMFLMGELEAVILNCYDRYINMIFLMVAYILVSEWIKLKYDGDIKLSLCISLVLCLFIPGEDLVKFVDRQNVYDSWAGTSFIEDVNKIEEAINFDVNRNGEDLNNDMNLTVGYLDLDKIPLLYHKIVRYGFNTNWNINGIEERLLTADKERYELDNYNYILIFNNTNRFCHLINAEIESVGNENFNLYRVQDMKLIRII